MIWTKEKTEILIEMYYDKSEEEICEAIGNTWGAIQGRANKLGLQRNYCKDIVWDENKKKILRKMYWISSWEEIFESLGIFNKRKILDQANKMGLERKKNFEEWEDDFIIENYSILSTEKISKKINRPIGSIQTRASQLGVNKQNVWKIFSDEEIISMLKKTYEKIGRFPQWRELSELNLPTGDVFSKRFGSYQNALNMIGGESGNSLYGVGGYSKLNHWCRSQSEIRVSNFLFENKISYTYEKYYSSIIPEIKGTKKFDWLLNDFLVFVEFFGLPQKEEYKKKMKEKIKMSKTYSFSLICILPSDLTEKKLYKIFLPYIK